MSDKMSDEMKDRKTESKNGTGLAPNIASFLCYLPFAGILFMLLEKENKEVQFHAWQSTVFGAGLIIAILMIRVLSIILGAIINFLGVVVGLLVPLIVLASFALWLVCLVKAYQGERWKIPYLGDFAEKQAGLGPEFSGLD